MSALQREEKHHRGARRNVCTAVSQLRKEPDAWITGDRPMTDAQAAYLKMLCERAGEAFFASLTKAEASKRIRVLRSRRW